MEENKPGRRVKQRLENEVCMSGTADKSSTPGEFGLIVFWCIEGISEYSTW